MDKFLIKGNAKLLRRQCGVCDRLYMSRNVIYFKGKYLCIYCRRKLPNSKIQESASTIGRPRITLEEALQKIYSPQNYQITIPLILINRKFRIVLVEDDKK